MCFLESLKEFKAGSIKSPHGNKRRQGSAISSRALHFELVSNVNEIRVCSPIEDCKFVVGQDHLIKIGVRF